MKKLIIALALFPSIAFAQPAEYNLKLTPQEVDLIGKSLAKLPYEEVANIIQKLRQQVVEQQQAKPPVEPKKE